MPKSSKRNRRWGVILAGGDGQRLRPLTKLIAGDDRPKQFCPLLAGGQTLLGWTRTRMVNAVATEQTLYALTRGHESFYSKELADVPAPQLVVQPSNRGTLPAVLSSLAAIARLDSDAIVAFCPSDHYYSNEKAFLQGVHSGFEAAAADPSLIVMLGTKAQSPETGYGYIEPAGEIPNFRGRLKRVTRFWEKPGSQVAQTLLDRGCLWNTFVTIGCVRAFLGLIGKAAPELYQAFDPIFSGPVFAATLPELERVYNEIPVSDLSQKVLSTSADRMAVLDLGEVGWSDLGDPHRVIDTLSKHGIPSPWHQLWLREMGIARVAG